MRIAGTGHRPTKLGGYTKPAHEKLKGIATTYLEVALEHTKLSGDRLVIISGMALGWDQALAWAAVELGVPFIAAIPCLNHESRWPEESQDSYRRLLAQALEKHIITNAPYRAWMMQRRNEWMVDEADRVVALWNGDAVGGTANCIDYANKKKVRVHNLWDLYTGAISVSEFKSSFNK